MSHIENRFLDGEYLATNAPGGDEDIVSTAGLQSDFPDFVHLDGSIEAVEVFASAPQHEAAHRANLSHRCGSRLRDLPRSSGNHLFRRPVPSVVPPIH